MCMMYTMNQLRLLTFKCPHLIQTCKYAMPFHHCAHFYKSLPQRLPSISFRKSAMNCNYLSKTCTFKSIGNARTIISLNDFWTLPRKKHGNYDLVQPGEITPPRPVPDFISKPDYAVSGIINNTPREAERKSIDQIQRMRDSCSLARKVLDEVSKYVQVGCTTDELDRIVHETCINHDAYPSPLNYRGFPKSVCTSINNVACHGIPDDRALKDGDIISIDVSVFYKGYHGDCAATFLVGSVDEKGQNLVEIAHKCLIKAIAVCSPGQKFSKIGRTISNLAEEEGFNVVPSFCGHGIGTFFHGPPEILHFVNNNDEIMEEGMTFTIEPVISEGRPDIVVLEDGWTAVSLDNSRSAQFEHTILITKSGAEILTESLN